MASMLIQLVMMSLTGTVLWLGLWLAVPLTKRIFSQTWHYYTQMIPLFFLMGGTKLSAKLFQRFFSSRPVKVEPPFEPVLVAAKNILETTNNIQPVPLQPATWLNFADILGILWIAGMVVYFGFNIRQYFVFLRCIKKDSMPYEIAACPLPVIQSPMAATPMLIGLRKPFIVLSVNGINEQSVPFVINHELIHYKRKDLIIKLVMLLVNGVHWFNPFVYLQNRNLDELCEYSCDELLVKEMDKSARFLYGNTLISYLEHGFVKRTCLYTSLGNVKNMKRRLSYMLHAKKMNKMIMGFSLAFVFGFTSLGALTSYVLAGSTETDNSAWYEAYADSIAAEKIYVNGEYLEGYPAFWDRTIAFEGIFEENILIPLRAVAEQFGLDISWDNKTNTATVSGNVVQTTIQDERYNVMQMGDVLYVSPGFFTHLLGVDLNLNYEGVVTEVFSQPLHMTFEGTDKWEDFQ